MKVHSEYIESKKKKKKKKKNEEFKSPSTNGFTENLKCLLTEGSVVSAGSLW